MTMDDKVCEQVSMTMLSDVYSREVIERCVRTSEPWSTKVRRGGVGTALAPALVLVALGVWGRRHPSQGWGSPGGKLRGLHPAQPDRAVRGLGPSGRRQPLGS